MKFTLLKQRHPSRDVLMSHAENLVDQKAAISASIAAHLVACKKCAAEADAMRASLEFMAQAPALEVTNESTARILLAAREERQNMAEASRFKFDPRSVTRALAYAAALLLVAGLAAAPVFLTNSAATITASVNNLKPVNVTQEVPANTGIRGAMDGITREIETLSDAVRATFDQPQTPREQKRKRAVNDMDIEIAAAMDALERNPGCVRAARLVQDNRQRQAETLRALYVERGL